MGDEGQIDAVTALSASGPAYFFYVMENLMAVARELGFSETASRQAILGTMAGALSLMQIEGADPAVLRKQVTSPQGTTAAALEIFEQGKLGSVLQDGVRAALARAKELSL